MNAITVHIVLVRVAYSNANARKGFVQIAASALNVRAPVRKRIERIVVRGRSKHQRDLSQLRVMTIERGVLV